MLGIIYVCIFRFVFAFDCSHSAFTIVFTYPFQSSVTDMSDSDNQGDNDTSNQVLPLDRSWLVQVDKVWTNI